MSVIKENLLNLQSTPEDDSDDRQYTDEKVVPLMLAFLNAAAQQNKTQFKLSECKVTMPTIAEKYLQLGVELLIERGFVKAPEGRSRVPLYEIAVAAVPKPAAAAAVSAPAARETKKPKATKETKETKKKDEQKKSENERNLEKKAEEEKTVPSKKRKSLAEMERADQSQSMVSPHSEKKKKTEKKVYISLPVAANAAATTTAPADDIEASELEGEVEKFNEQEETETTKPAYAALFEPPAKSDEEKAQEEREKQLEQAVADRLLALQVDSAPLSLFVQSVLADRPQFSEEDVRRMLDVFQDRNNIMLDGETIYVI